jgi:hypothetical protein
LDDRQVWASTLADQACDLTRATASRQRGGVFRDPPGRRPGLRRGDLTTGLGFSNDGDPGTARDRSESVELTQQGP